MQDSSSKQPIRSVRSHRQNGHAAATCEKSKGGLADLIVFLIGLLIVALLAPFTRPRSRRAHKS